MLAALRRGAATRRAAATWRLAAALGGVRAAALAVLLGVLIARTREPRRRRRHGSPPVDASGCRARVRAHTHVAGARDRTHVTKRRASRARPDRVSAIVTAATRRATLFQVMGVVLVENGLALAALTLPGISSPASRARRRGRPQPSSRSWPQRSASGSSPSSAPETRAALRTLRDRPRTPRRRRRFATPAASGAALALAPRRLDRRPGGAGRGGHPGDLGDARGAGADRSGPERR